jgi:signal transduction histidine kinase
VITGSAPVTRVGRDGSQEVETLYAPFDVQGQRLGTLAVTAQTAPAYSSVRGTGIRLGLILLAAMAGMVGIGALMSRFILAQLSPLIETNRALGSGDFSARVPVVSEDELGQVARGVNQMAEQLQANVETLESRVAQRTEEVRRLLEERTEFFAGLSHELRTPLAVILSQAQMLRNLNGRKTGEVSEAITESAQQLLGLVNEILELARAEASGIQLHIEDLRLPEVMRSLRGTLIGLSRSGGLKLNVDVPRDLPPVQADGERLRQVLLNLVDNAVKYTPPGGSVRLSAGAQNGTVTVSVADSGVGIPSEIGDRIFEPFFRVPDTSPQGGQASSGLGLALTKRLVEAHGGQLWYESGEAEGTTFRFTLPTATKGRG